MIDMTSEFGQFVDKRLRNEDLIWLTTVNPGNAPQPNPVWFYWDGETIFLYSKPDSFRVRNLQHNQKVALNLQEVSVLGENVVILHGDAQLNFHYPQVHPEYEKKYIRHLAEWGVTKEELESEYTVEITIKPTRLHR